ncbi:MAG: hypothetical protein GY757_49005 [bacterium]|nr:hypothetical protein [bacterium]
MEPYKANLTKKSFNEKKSLLKKVGLRGTLMFYFLALALIPLLLVSVLSYQNAKISLRDAAEESLVSIGRQKTREIRTYFNSMLTDLDLQAGMQANSVFLEALTKAMHESGQSADDFTKSYKCKMLVEEMGKDLKSYTQKMGYYDLFLIDSVGNILFSSSEEKALGITLFNEEHSGKKFSAACKKTLLTGQPAFSDYETFEFSGNKVFGFMASVILNEAGDKIGLIALQFPINPIDEIIHAELDKNSGTLIYLVGSDKTLRSHLKGEEEGILKTKVQHGQIA